MLLSKKFFIGLICLFLAILFLFLALQGRFYLNKTSEFYTSSALDMIDQRMGSLFLEINNFPGGAAEDILFLSKLSCFQDAVNDPKGEFASRGVKNIRKDFLAFLKQSSAYYQLRYIDKTGQEIVRVDFDGQDYKSISGNVLQDKSLRYYFNQAMSLEPGEVYISPLDLNVENEEIENRGTKNEPIYIPVIRYATPVSDKHGDKKGIIITNIYADYFLEDIRRFQRQGEIVFLINPQGYYLAHPDRGKEFAFMFEKDNNFLNDYPAVPREILSNLNIRRFETDEFIFSFRHIYPTTSNFEIYQGSKRVFGRQSEENYFWVLASVSDKEEINKALGDLKRDYLSFLLFSGIIFVIIITLILILTFKIPKRENE